MGNEANESLIRDLADRLCVLAEQKGIVLRIGVVPTQPLRMGGHYMKVETWIARDHRPVVETHAEPIEPKFRVVRGSNYDKDYFQESFIGEPSNEQLAHSLCGRLNASHERPDSVCYLVVDANYELQKGFEP